MYLVHRRARVVQRENKTSKSPEMRMFSFATAHPGKRHRTLVRRRPARTAADKNSPPIDLVILAQPTETCCEHTAVRPGPQGEAGPERNKIYIKHHPHSSLTRPSTNGPLMVAE